MAATTACAVRANKTWSLYVDPPSAARLASDSCRLIKKEGIIISFGEKGQVTDERLNC